MTAQKHTISLSKEQSEFIIANPELSLSKVCQVSLTEIMERHKIIQKDVEIQKKRSEKLQNYVLKLTTFIEKIGQWEKFLSMTDLGEIFPK